MVLPGWWDAPGRWRATRTGQLPGLCTYADISDRATVDVPEQPARMSLIHLPIVAWTHLPLLPADTLEIAQILPHYVEDLEAVSWHWAQVPHQVFKTAAQSSTAFLFAWSLWGHSRVLLPVLDWPPRALGTVGQGGIGRRSRWDWRAARNHRLDAASHSYGVIE